MPHNIPDSPAPSLRLALTRRRFLSSTGAGIASLVLSSSAVGHDGDHDDDSDHDDDDGHNEDDDRNRDDDVRPSSTVPAGSAEVRIDDDDADGFEPGTITIDLGGSVTWVNVDDDPHTATGAGFDTGRIEPGSQATVKFDEPGSFPYSCQFHPIMTGVVEVRDKSGQVPARDTASPQASPDATPQRSAAPSDDEVAVSITNMAFAPSERQITVGTTVVWTNDEPIPHTVTSNDGTLASDTLQVNDTFRHTFGSPGSFDYFCAIHPNMKGNITVTD
jgi:plastocyanin